MTRASGRRWSRLWAAGGWTLSILSSGCSDEPAGQSSEPAAGADAAVIHPSTGERTDPAPENTPEADPPDALIRTLSGHPVPLYESYDHGLKEPLEPVASPALVREITSVAAPRHHGQMLAYEVHLMDDRRGWVSPEHLMMAGVRSEDSTAAPLLRDDHADAPVLTEIEAGARLFYDPSDQNPYDSKQGCEGDWVRVRSLDGHEGFLACGSIQ